jgi:hypothetical protein
LQPADHVLNKDNPIILKMKKAEETAAGDHGEDIEDEDGAAAAAPAAAAAAAAGEGGGGGNGGRRSAQQAQPLPDIEPGCIGIDECMHMFEAQPLQAAANSLLERLKCYMRSYFAQSLFNALAIVAPSSPPTAASVAQEAKQLFNCIKQLQPAEPALTDAEAAELKDLRKACKARLRSFFKGRWQRVPVASQGSRAGLPESCMPSRRRVGASWQQLCVV